LHLNFAFDAKIAVAGAAVLPQPGLQLLPRRIIILQANRACGCEKIIG